MSGAIRARLTMLHMIQLKRAYSKLGAYFWNYSQLLSTIVQSTISNTKNSIKKNVSILFHVSKNYFEQGSNWRAY